MGEGGGRPDEVNREPCRMRERISSSSEEKIRVNRLARISFLMNCDFKVTCQRSLRRLLPHSPSRDGWRRGLASKFAFWPGQSLPIRL
jgi:hypothetical protein